MLYLEADLQGYLEFMYLAVNDPAALFDHLNSSESMWRMVFDAL